MRKCLAWLLAFAAICLTRTTNAAWTWQGQAWPASASNSPMTFDVGRQRVQMYLDSSGGAGNYLWEFDGTAWSNPSSAVSPPASMGAVFVYDSNRQETILFGAGGDSLNPSNETWRLSAGAWTKLSPAALPPARSYSCGAYDPVRRVIVVFGGQGIAAANFNDTWLWNGTTWTQSTATPKPPARSSCHMAFDTARGVAVLFGGYGYNDTWEWDGSAWTQRITAHAPPAVRQGFAMAFDAKRGKTVLNGGDDNTTTFDETWTYDGTDWTQLVAVTAKMYARYGHAMTYDSVRERVVVFGGNAHVPAILGAQTSYNDTWQWDGSGWSFLIPVPPARSSAAIALDSARNRLIMTGGTAATTANASLSDTWAFENGVWSLLNPPTPAPARNGAKMVFDTVRQVGVMFGGNAGFASPGSVNETWLWNGTTWAMATPPMSPPARGAMSLAFDEARGEVVMFGGRVGGTYVDETWTWNGTTWTKKSPAHSPPARGDAAMGYVGGGLTLLFGGSASTAVNNETWQWDGADWTLLAPATIPPLLNGASMFTGGGRVLMVGVSFANAPFYDLWQWVGGNWQSQPTSSNGVTPQANVAIGYDARSGRFAFFGGGGSTRSMGTTWQLYNPDRTGASCASSVDCGGGPCIDGACCEALCGACSTCNGIVPGRCEPVKNRSDADSCSAADGLACDDLARCKKALGVDATSAASCASGFLADGVCCDQPCQGGCMACRAEHKQSGTRSGVCDFAKEGLDPSDSCDAEPAMSCGKDGTCDGRGGCRLQPQGRSCGAVQCKDTRATGQICNGLGACTVSAEGVLCGAYACADSLGCRSTCADNSQCSALHHCEAGACVADRGAVCGMQDDHTLLSADGATVDCSPYKCAGSVCKEVCSSIVDCTYPNSCSREGKCVAPTADAPVDTGGCAAAATMPTGCVSMVGLGLLASAARRRRSRRRQRM